MGSSSSKPQKNEALHLCKERRRFIKQAIDSRYALAAAHVSYIQSLRNIGVALRRFAEAEVLIESSLSISATELDKTPSHSSYHPSPSPSHNADALDSPLPNESPFLSPISPPLSTLSYMRSGGNGVVTMRINPPANSFVDDDSLAFPMPPPPPPPPEVGGSWDFFDPSGESESFRFVGNNGPGVNFGDLKTWRQLENEAFADEMRAKSDNGGSKNCEISSSLVPMNHVVNAQLLNGKEVVEKSGESEKELCAEREDPSEFITHRAKDFLSSIKDIENRFFRASESGKEVAKMFEANKIKIGYSVAKGKSSASAVLVACHLVCCRGKSAPVSHEPPQHVTKVITWKRSTSSHSSSSKNPLTTASKDDADDSGSEFVEEYCMIAGSHSSTLDRLYAWERKLYDEVKASECIRKEYDRKCNQLRHQFAKDHSAQVIDKTRAVVKDLHSRIRVAIHAVDSISRRIEKMRDEELLPQLVELIQGLIKMWKSMLECHHTQYITISLAYHARSSSSGTPRCDTHQQVMAQLYHEIECFSISFTDWIKRHTSYIDSLNNWLQNCILQPQERSKSRRAFSPRRVLAPPLFVLCRDWLAGIKSLPSDELKDAIKSLLSDLHDSMGEAEEVEKKQKLLDSNNHGESIETKEEEKVNDGFSSNLSCIHTSLTKVLDRLTKFSEASLKMYEDIRQKTETARISYLNSRTTRF